MRVAQEALHAFFVRTKQTGLVQNHALEARVDERLDNISGFLVVRRTLIEERVGLMRALLWVSGPLIDGVSFVTLPPSSGAFVRLPRFTDSMRGVRLKGGFRFVPNAWLLC